MATKKSPKKRTRRRFDPEQKATILAELAQQDIKQVGKRHKIDTATLYRWAAAAGLSVKKQDGERQSVPEEKRAAILAEFNNRSESGKTADEIATAHGVSAQAIYGWIARRKKTGKRRPKRAPAARAGRSVSLARSMSNGHAAPGSLAPPSNPALALAEAESLLGGVLTQIASAKTALTAFWRVFGEGGQPHADIGNGTGSSVGRRRGGGRHPNG